MALTAAELIARVSVVGVDEAAAKLQAMGGATDAASKKFAGLAVLGAGVVAAGLIAVGVKSVQMAADFQQAVNRLRTGAGDMQDSFASLYNGILNVSVATGVSTDQLSKAMYEILSSGQRGAQAFDTLTAAAKGAQIEQAKVADVANTLSTTMTDFGTKTFGATQYMNGLITAVALGKITLQDLSTAMGPIEPLARNLGIKFSDLSAAMSVQTNAGIGAARAATGLRFMFQALESPTGKASDAMKKFGLDSVAVANEMKVSLPDALQMVWNAAKKAGPEGSVPFTRALSDMVGGARGLMSFLALTGPHMDAFRANVLKIAASMKSGKGDVSGWEIAQQNFNIVMDKAKATVDAFLIRLGTGLLPVLSKLLGVVPVIVNYISNFSQHANVLVPIIAGLGAIIATVLVPAVWSLAAGVIAATWPLLAIGGAVAIAAALFMHFYQQSAPFRAFIDGVVAGVKQVAGFFIANLIPAVQQVWTWISKYLLPIFLQIGAYLASNFAPVWKQLVDVWNGQILPSLKQLWAAIQPLLPLLGGLAAIVGGLLVIAFGVLVSILAGVVRALAGFLSGLAIAIGGVVQLVTGVIQVISGIVRFIVDLITGHFERLSGDLGTIWAGIKNIFIGAWNVIKGVFLAAWGAISGYVSGFVNSIINFFTHLYNMLVGHSIVPDMINAIVGVFLSLPGRALSAISGLAGMVLGFFSNLAGSLFNAGMNIVKGIADGITAGIGWVATAIGNVVNFISSHLPHSPAKLGPLRDLEFQGQQISAQIASGMKKNLPVVSASLNAIFSPMVAPPPAFTPARSTGGTAAPPQINVSVYLDGAPVAKKLMPHIVSAIRYSTGSHGL